MALTSASTETNARDQYYNSVDGWRDSVSTAKDLVQAMEWLAMKHQAQSLSTAGRSIVMSPIFDSMYKEASAFVASSSTSRPSLFSRGRVTGLGRW